MKVKVTTEGIKQMQLHDSSADFIRFRIASHLGSALIDSMRGRLVEDQVGEDNKPVKTGGLRTGQMWRSFRLKPGGRGARGMFTGRSFNSWYYERMTAKGIDEATLKKQDKAQRRKIANKRGVALGKVASRKMVENRVKASSVQWGYDNENRTSDFRNREFLGFTDDELQAVVEWWKKWALERSVSEVTSMAYTLDTAFKRTARFRKNMNRRIRYMKRK